MGDRNVIIAAAATLVVGTATTFEGVKLTPYYDPPHVLTVCMGETHNVQNRRYTLAECKAMLQGRALETVRAVEKCAPGLKENELAAFSDAAYNLGTAVICDTKSYTLARKLKAGDVAGACREVPKFVYARIAGVATKLPGLVRRREYERKLCLGEA